MQKKSVILSSLQALHEKQMTLPRRLSKNRKSTAEKPFWPVFPIIFVKEHNYSPQMIEKSDSKWLSLATTPILGQSPRMRV